jgi:hypothetical protein
METGVQIPTRTNECRQLLPWIRSALARSRRAATTPIKPVESAASPPHAPTNRIVLRTHGDISPPQNAAAIYERWATSKLVDFEHAGELERCLYPKQIVANRAPMLTVAPRRRASRPGHGSSLGGKDRIRTPERRPLAFLPDTFDVESVGRLCNLNPLRGGLSFGQGGEGQNAIARGRASPNNSVRPNGAVHQWRKDPPGSCR